MNQAPKEWLVIMLLIIMSQPIIAQFDYKYIEDYFLFNGKPYLVKEYAYTPNPTNSVNGKYFSKTYEFNEYGKVVQSVYFGINWPDQERLLFKDSLDYDDQQNLVSISKISPKKQIKYPKSIRGKLKLEEKIEQIEWGAVESTISYRYDSLNSLINYISYNHSTRDSILLTYENRYDKEGRIAFRYSGIGINQLPLDSFRIDGDTIFHYKYKTIMWIGKERIEQEWPLWRKTYYHKEREKYLIQETKAGTRRNVIVHNAKGLPVLEGVTGGDIYTKCYYDDRDFLIRKSVYIRKEMISSSFYEYEQID